VPSEGGSIGISLGLTPEDGLGHHILHQAGECHYRRADDITIVLVIATHEMRSLPRFRLCLDQLLNDVLQGHRQIDVILHIRRHFHIRRWLGRWL
jgi:hypothetical protein